MIRARRVSKTFPGGVVALDRIDLRVDRGEMVMIVGPSGSGKSTLLFTLGAMLAPSKGRIRLGKTDIYRLSAARRAALRRQKLGFMFQTFNLVPYLSCLDNVALPAALDGRSRGESTERAREMLDRLGMSHRLGHRPGQLSVGERQRAALCRSLINEPDVLLADEPTGNLDGDLTDEVMALLRDESARGQTILMATHDRRLAELGTRVIGLDQGQIVFDRAPERMADRGRGPRRVADENAPRKKKRRKKRRRRPAKAEESAA